ncbi:uncharacterized protein LOC124283436 [Haliotis rubra]|uniref:uncharacterized protein LOC124283436 n=1 Tax=Haliotis rubra TaxID=36100 RepID=UPI001EE54718|nr:uncharacterized protein LOC124283436 [Haliotis rubra]
MNNHKLFYGRARTVFGCRVKRVWFQLNPFLERTKVKDDEHGVYQPSSKFVLPLQSIVLCEDMNSDADPGWQEISAASFWDYLYSNSWGEECSLRVMDGELLELLLTTLFAMDRDQEVASHNTFAYTTNTRVNHAYFKSAEAKKKEHFINETLLIDFTYYGRRTRPMEMDFSGSTVYPFSLTSSRGLSSSDYTSTSLESSEGTPYKSPERPPIPVQNTLESSETSPLLFSVRQPKSVKVDTVNIKLVDSGLLGIKGPVRAIPVTALVNTSPFDSSGSTMIKSFIKESSLLLAKKKTSHHQAKGGTSDQDRNSPILGNQRARRQSKMPTVFETRNRRQQTPTVESPTAAPGSQRSESTTDNTESSETGLRLLEFNLAKLPCSERTKAGLENWKLDKYAYIRSPPGNEYFLQDNDTANENISAREKLLKNRNRMNARREEERKEEQARMKFFEKKSPKPLKYEEEVKPEKPLLRCFSHAPSFCTFLQWLEGDNKFDPRFKKGKQRKKKLMKKYKLKSSEIQLDASTKSSRSSVSRSSVSRSIGGTGSPTMDDIHGITKPVVNRRNGADFIRFAEEAGGVTDSPAVKNTLLARECIDTHEAEEEVFPLGGHISRPPRQKRMSFSAEPNNGPSEGNSDFHARQSDKRRKSLDVKDGPRSSSRSSLASPGQKSNSLSSKESSSRIKSSTSSQKLSRASSGSKSGGSLFKKNDLRSPGRDTDLETESADTESDEESELEDSLFDTNKLNKRYSFEKLRGKNYHKKKPAFFDILKKYYRVQKAMNMLRGPSKMSSVISNASKTTTAKAKPSRNKPVAGLLRRLTRPVKPKRDIVLGKIKTFKFQQFNNHQLKIPDVEVPDFSEYPMNDFVANLVKALDDFVVRKENVISSYGMETITTVTFTRPQVFTKMLHIG